jgi:hypothetical protein
MTDPTTARAALTPRDVIAVALLVLGCMLLSEVAWELVGFLPVGGLDVVKNGEFFIPPAILGLLCIALRNRLADRLGVTAAPASWQLDWRQIQLAAIQFLGLWLAASALQQVRWSDAGRDAVKLAHWLHLGPLAVSPPMVGEFAIGLLLTLVARPLNAWLVRDRERQAGGLEES